MKRLNGQKEEVIRHLQSLPQEEADKLRWKLVNDLERYAQRTSSSSSSSSQAGGSLSGASGGGANKRSPGKKKPPQQVVAAAPLKGKTSVAVAAAKPQEGAPPLESSSEESANGVKRSSRVIMDRYQMGEAIGKGGFATVYRALDTERGDFVAVKEIERRLLAEDQLPKIMQEAELLKRLSHANIVGFRGSCESSKHIHFVLEFVEGGSLYRVVKKFGVFSEKLCALYIKQVLQGLQYLHEQGVIHRDIKGANLLLTKEGQVKLADFGACTYAALNKNLTVVGTPFWMAPEIIEISGKDIGTPADIWSLGCTILELMTGVPPYFSLGTMQALFKMVEDPHPPIPDTFSPDLIDFLLKCFTKEVTRRATAKQLLTHKWIVENGTQNLTREQLQGTLRNLNKSGAPVTSAKDVFAPADAPLSAEDKATKLKLTRTKEAIAALLAEQQAVQKEIVAAQKRKAALEQSVAALKQQQQQPLPSLAPQKPSSALRPGPPLK